MRWELHQCIKYEHSTVCSAHGGRVVDITDKGKTVFLKPAGLILQWQCNEGVHGSVDVEVNVGYQAIDDNHGQAAKRHCQQQDERRFAAYQGTRSVHQKL